MSKPDELQLKHALDQIEMHFATIKEAAFNSAGDPDEIEDLEYELRRAEEELEDEENRADELEGDLKKIKYDILSLADVLTKFAQDIERDFPSYDISDLQDVIQKLEDL
jgi:septal ring factor EnvC (AmiA/AmiB activator)